jgi:hypothetical protein
LLVPPSQRTPVTPLIQQAFNDVERVSDAQLLQMIGADDE